MLHRICGSRMERTSSTSTVLAKSQICSISSRLRSVRVSSSSPCTGMSTSTSPSFSTWTILVWNTAMRTCAECSPFQTVRMMSKVTPFSTCRTLISVWSRYARMALVCSGVTSAITSSFFSCLPATMPAAAAASRPFMLSVLGTMTDLTFLIMLPLASTSTLSGSSPSVLRAAAAA